MSILVVKAKMRLALKETRVGGRKFGSVGKESKQGSRLTPAGPRWVGDLTYTIRSIVARWLCLLFDRRGK